MKNVIKNHEFDVSLHRSDIDVRCIECNLLIQISVSIHSHTVVTTIFIFSIIIVTKIVNTVVYYYLLIIISIDNVITLSLAFR